MQPETENRSQGRSNVFLSASLFAGPVPLPVRVRNLSTRGALLDGGSLPPAGTRVRLVRGALNADGQIAWQGHGHAGIRFNTEIDVGQWVTGVGHAGQQRVDQAIAALRRDEPAPANVPAMDTPTLRQISEGLDAICERLAGSQNLTVELGEELVKLDALSRSLQQLASSG